MCIFTEVIFHICFSFYTWFIFPHYFSNIINLLKCVIPPIYFLMYDFLHSDNFEYFNNWFIFHMWLYLLCSHHVTCVYAIVSWTMIWTVSFSHVITSSITHIITWSFGKYMWFSNKGTLTIILRSVLYLMFSLFQERTMASESEMLNFIPAASSTS